jgi:hypothetical protein
MTFAKHPNLLAGFKTWIAIGFSSWMVLGITACGGGSGPSAPVPPDVPVVTLMTPGAYENEGSVKNWAIILLPSDPASANGANFFALNYKTDGPDIYSGTGQITGNNSASLTQIKLHPYAAAVRTGSASLNSVNTGQVQAILDFPVSGSGNTPVIDLTLRTPEGYVDSNTASLAAVQGDWPQGILSFGTTNNTFSINVSSTGDVSSYMNFAGDCRFALGNLKADFTGTNLFKFTATISSGTNCNSWANQSVTGAGFVRPNTEPGKTQRLYLVGVTTDGRGISFKADR